MGVKTPYKDRVGKKYGAVTVLKLLPGRKFLGRCDCGVERVFDMMGLVKGSTKSCGCLRDKTRMYSMYYDNIIKLHNEGFSLSQISKTLNIPYQPLFKIKRRLGLKSRKGETLIEKFNRLVIKNDTGCWGWKGTVVKSGYAKLSEGKGKKLHPAHRISYEIHNGPVLGKNVLHKCDNPICTNPDHLFLGTIRDNSIDMIVKGRHSIATLKAADIPKIRRLIRKGMPISKIAKKYKVSAGAIYSIKSGNTWWFIPDDKSINQGV